MNNSKAIQTFGQKRGVVLLYRNRLIHLTFSDISAPAEIYVISTDEAMLLIDHD